VVDYANTNGHEYFFPFKNRLSQSYSPYSSASIDAMTRPLIHWRVLAIRAMVGPLLVYHIISLGLNYCSMGLFKQPLLYTVPLM
jgi:hypothetical protein